MDSGNSVSPLYDTPSLPSPKLDLGDQQYLMAICLFMKHYVCGYSGATSGSAGGATVDTTKAEPIDNKIEQAMDLVKSHLLLAVREEVDVLKTTIGRLMERISSLERENDVLRVNVPADVLHQLETLASAAPPPAAAPPAALPPTSQPSVTASQCPSTTASPPNAPPGGGSV